MMKINPDDPWYPSEYDGLEAGVTIRLKLATEMMKSPYLPELGDGPTDCFQDRAFRIADAMIERANRDEGKQPERR